MSDVMRQVCRRLFIALFVLVVAAIHVGCSQEARSSEDFLNGISRLEHWTTNGWIGISYQDEERLLNSFCTIINAESNGQNRAKLYGVYTNALLNVSFFSTNGVVRVNELPRGWYQPPYLNRMRAFLSLIERSKDKFGGWKRYDSFCLDLEAWKRLCREKDQSRDTIETWMRMHYVDVSDRFIDKDAEWVTECLEQEMRTLARSLEGRYRKESDESRRAYELFRQVIGREAVPPYKRNRD